MIPQQNVKNLMLREDVVEAIRDRKFHIYAVRSIDEGIGILTGREPGVRQPDGSYPDGSISYLVNQRLQELAQTMRGHYGDLLTAPNQGHPG
jgi:predicted ATP-dependent protease